MIATFCGHSQLYRNENVKIWLQFVTKSLIEQGIHTFYLGGYGEFDHLAASVLREQKKKHPQIELVLVLAYANTRRETSGYDRTIYPPLENVPRRFAISHRNRWMVEASDVVVAYVLHDWGGAATTLRCAKQKKSRLFHTVTRWAAEAALFLGGKLHGNHTHHAAAHRQGPNREPCHQRNHRLCGQSAKD